MGLFLSDREKVGLGHTRLSILDLSDAGHQPMCTEPGPVSLTFNGEIYNFLELREELEKEGVMFRSHTDTEVVLHAYVRWGNGFVKKLNGIFAFALFDGRRGKLLLARDPVGVKPLYYFQGPGAFVFGSEIKAILASGACPRDINWQACYDYFTYLFVPGPATAFKNVFQVPPAHFLEYNLRSRSFTLERYWRPDGNGLRCGASNAADFASSKEHLRTQFAAIVRRQMISDAPLGMFLSGGIDSQIIAGLMAKASGRQVKTFTVVFRGKEFASYDESRDARLIALKIGAEHREIDVSVPDPAEMLDLVKYFDQPFGNPTFYLMYLMSKSVRSEIKVALCGAGGDELFAGYPRYKALRWSKRLDWIPEACWKAAGHVLGAIPSMNYDRSLRRARKFLAGMQGDLAERYLRWTYFLMKTAKKACSRIAARGCGPGRQHTLSERFSKGVRWETSGTGFCMSMLRHSWRTMSSNIQTR